MRHSAYLPAEGTAWEAERIWEALNVSTHDELPEGKLLFLGQNSCAQRASYWNANGRYWQIWPMWTASGYLRGCARQISREDIPQSALS